VTITLLLITVLKRNPKTGHDQRPLPHLALDWELILSVLGPGRQRVTNSWTMLPLRQAARSSAAAMLSSLFNHLPVELLNLSADQCQNPGALLSQAVLFAGVGARIE